MSLSNQYQVNSEKVKGGVAIEYGENKKKLDLDGQPLPIKLTLAHMHRTNKDYQMCLNRHMKPVQQKLERGQLPRKEQEKITQEVFAEIIVKGWENVPLSDVTGNAAEEDQIAEFTYANVLALLQRLPHLYELAVADAQNVEYYKDEIREAEAGN